jgi:hypothetical protein
MAEDEIVLLVAGANNPALTSVRAGIATNPFKACIELSAVAGDASTTKEDDARKTVKPPDELAPIPGPPPDRRSQCP